MEPKFRLHYVFYKTPKRWEKCYSTYILETVYLVIVPDPGDLKCYRFLVSLVHHDTILEPILSLLLSSPSLIIIMITVNMK